MYDHRERLLHHLRGCEGIEGVRGLAPKLKYLSLSERDLNCAQFARPGRKWLISRA